MDLQRQKSKRQRGLTQYLEQTRRGLVQAALKQRKGQVDLWRQQEQRLEMMDRIRGYYPVCEEHFLLDVSSMHQIVADNLKA